MATAKERMDLAARAKEQKELLECDSDTEQQLAVVELRATFDDEPSLYDEVP